MPAVVSARVALAARSGAVQLHCSVLARHTRHIQNQTEVQSPSRSAHFKLNSLNFFKILAAVSCHSPYPPDCDGTKLKLLVRRPSATLPETQTCRSSPALIWYLPSPRLVPVPTPRSSPAQISGINSSMTRPSYSTSPIRPPTLSLVS